MTKHNHDIGHIRLLTHPNSNGRRPREIRWGASRPDERGPLIATLTDVNERNVIGAHGGSYGVYRALAVAAGALDPRHQPDLTDTRPPRTVGPHASWHDADRIVSLDPYGHLVSDAFSDELAAGLNIQPTIAVTTAHIELPEIKQAIAEGRLVPDGSVLRGTGDVVVTKAAIEPAWHLPGVAKRFGIKERDLRRTLFEQTAGMYPELVTRGDLEVFLPPIGGQTVYLFGDVDRIAEPSVPLTARVHDECNGSDVFGSDICTCRPYLTHAIEECVRSAQEGGTGLIAYFRKEGRALGEVTKFLVYNARKRQAGGDRADAYFARTECVAGVQDVRFQELMPDVLHWLGIRRIDRFVSMSNVKYDAIVASGIEIGERVKIPDDLVPADARVEIEAKIASGYYTEGSIPPSTGLAQIKGRGLEE
ncbi:MAG: GTP cyclohydrolase II [Myxococcales bacterium]|nr:GTP cyclohydrolase II [Myxococcales bacterium]MDD9966399.1 GTP cyclohydrolase II [Myxococcales bacterium]